VSEPNRHVRPRSARGTGLRRAGRRLSRPGAAGRNWRQSGRRARRGSQIRRPQSSDDFARSLPLLCAHPILGTKRTAVHFALSSVSTLADSMDLSAETTRLPQSLFSPRSAPRSGYPAEPPKGDLAVEAGEMIGNRMTWSVLFRLPTPVTAAANAAVR